MKKFVVCTLLVLLFSCNVGWSSETKDKIGSPHNEQIVSPSKAVSLPDSKLEWYDGKDLFIVGKGWEDTSTYYERLPAKAEGKVTKAVWNLNKHTSGLALRFVTDSKRIGAIWDGGSAMSHMAATGNCGLDLYVKKNTGWKYLATGKPSTTHTTKTIKSYLSEKKTEYLIYLPLYHQITDIKIGIDSGSQMIIPKVRLKKPIVFYGTSITQGGCASRAGMSHPAILGRWLDREIINLGFSGSGKMEPEMGELLSELDPVLYVLECLPNMTIDMVKERLAPFVKALRKNKPDTPILLVENPIPNPNEKKQNKILYGIYKDLKKEKVSRLYYLKGDKQYAGRENGTVDGIHPTDLGFHRMAEIYEPTLKKILKKYGD